MKSLKIYLILMFCALIFSGCSFLMKLTPGPLVNNDIKSVGRFRTEISTNKAVQPPPVNITKNYDVKILGLKNKNGIIYLYGEIPKGEKIMFVLGKKELIPKTLEFVKKKVGKKVVMLAEIRKADNVDNYYVRQLMDGVEIIFPMIEASLN